MTVFDAIDGAHIKAKPYIRYLLIWNNLIIKLLPSHIYIYILNIWDKVLFLQHITYKGKWRENNTDKNE